VSGINIKYFIDYFIFFMESIIRDFSSRNNLFEFRCSVSDSVEISFYSFDGFFFGFSGGDHLTSYSFIERFSSYYICKKGDCNQRGNINSFFKQFYVPRLRILSIIDIRGFPSCCSPNKVRLRNSRVSVILFENSDIKFVNNSL
jgi:hypothetical protein